jgi:hypothetical protein
MFVGNSQLDNAENGYGDEQAQKRDDA